MAAKDSGQIWDCVIVGAGAAGLMTAIQLGRQNNSVLLLDSKPKIGAKILMSGGTRCNITNRKVQSEDYQSESPRIVNAILKSFRSDQSMSFFEDLGVPLIEEPGGKIFPETHSGRTVLTALTAEIERLGIQTAWGRRVESLSKQESFLIAGSGFEYRARTVVLTTGGLSFPATGSDGGGYRLAQSLGHSLVHTTPSLTPLKTGDALYKKLSGISLPVRLTFLMTGGKKQSYVGSMLFTHFGLSGPVVLNISRFWIRAGKDGSARLQVNYLPQTREDIFREELKNAYAQGDRRLLDNWLAAQLPLRFAQAFLQKHGIENVCVNQLKRETREKIIKELFNEEVNVTGFLGYEKAEVTAGGIRLDEIDKISMESEKCGGLFLAGEILDVDGRIGGFNFQWAWASGNAAAGGVSRYLSRNTE